MPHATPKLTSADRLRHLVEARIAESPYQCEGHQWAAEPQSGMPNNSAYPIG